MRGNAVKRLEDLPFDPIVIDTLSREKLSAAER
jgi:hypothetical protein